MGKVVVMLGPIGAGKTAQGERMAARFNMEMFSLGQLIREDKHDGAHAAMSKGDLSPTDYVQALITKKFASIPVERNIVFDAAPLPEEIEMYANVLPTLGHQLSLAVVIGLETAHVDERLKARFEQYGRDDDRPEAIINRWKRYNEVTVPTFPLYEQYNIPLVEVDGNGTLEVVSDRIANVFKEQGIVE